MSRSLSFVQAGEWFGINEALSVLVISRSLSPWAATPAPIRWGSTWHPYENAVGLIVYLAVY